MGTIREADGTAPIADDAAFVLERCEYACEGRMSCGGQVQFAGKLRLLERHAGCQQNVQHFVGPERNGSYTRTL